MRQSLAAGSAKIWIDEKGARSQRGDDITELKADLEVEPWLSTANAYVAAPTKYPDPDREIKAVDGVKAPEGTIVEVKGAFFDQDGQERVAENKKDRIDRIEASIAGAPELRGVVAPPHFPGGLHARQVRAISRLCASRLGST